MTGPDGFETQRDVATGAGTAAELGGAGFDDVQQIGSGGFGVVYRCAQPELDRTVAVKVLTADLDEESLARFLREQRAMGRLTGHPNIVNILHVGTTDSGHPYIVMPYHPQGSLEERIRRDGPLELDELVHLGVKMAGALETAHQLGVIHRDVKPGNILITEYAEPALTDFGIARVSGGFETGSDAVTGSPAFMAPELIEGSPPSPASDVYGLGATLFCAATGHAAFERRSGERLVAQFVRITSQPVPDLREEGIPDEVSSVVERAMDADPHERPTATEFGNALRQFQLHHRQTVDDMALPTGPDDTTPGTPASTVPAVRDRTLPLELTSFVGRRHELAQIKNDLAASHLVALTGIGGVGKTRLALRAAADLRRAFDDGVYLAELAEVGDGSLVVDVVAAALRLQNRSPRPLVDAVIEFVASRHVLLVLDNCEHVVEAAADLAHAMLRAGPQLRILATSREPLGIQGETVFRVPPLATPDLERRPGAGKAPPSEAMTLFAERAAAAEPGFELTESNKETVAEICRHLDGLPLPIELAAARTRAMSPQQILERLTDRYKLLVMGPRGVPTRMQTLRLSMDWSFELLQPVEQLLWARLAVFAGSFEIDAAEGICAEGMTTDELLDLVTSLVDKSILIRGPVEAVARFRMLETVREFGREKSEQSGEYPELRRRHRDWYQQLVLDAEADWINPRQVEWIVRLDRELPNLREAMAFSLAETSEPDNRAGLRIAGALFPFWLSRGLLREGRHWLDLSLALRPRRPTAERLNALQAASMLAGLQRDIPAATASITEGQSLIDELDDPESAARLALADGFVTLYSGDPDRAIERLHSAIDTVGTHEVAPYVDVGIQVILGWAYGMRGDIANATECNERVLTTTEARGESMFRSYTLWGDGIARWIGGDLDWARRSTEDGLRLIRSVDDPATGAAFLESLAWIAWSADQTVRAAELLGAADSLRRAMGLLLIPQVTAVHEQCEQSVSRSLGKRAYDAARRTGEALSFDEAVAYALHERAEPSVPQTSPGPDTTLTKRERQIAELVAEGLTNKEIATRLVISPRTAEGHVEHIRTKLDFASRAQIAAWVVERKQAGNP
ncbi:protein kinase domain-containing protein [Prescottella agglutinans]|uniref:ATPase/DNA-binding NarL/FixJ family response regulator n=1 Tax=Prescottella agglutinans TaxID=1644129 RepID=A0ABT6M766_9NOCA|nr:protein kinase [Prescottella agglutinans]MDH6280090.1 putative ATPase/DNA-binding NarL/FixJ family response regulator [Prescottella agglutinans]